MQIYVHKASSIYTSQLVSIYTTNPVPAIDTSPPIPKPIGSFGVYRKQSLSDPRGLVTMIRVPTAAEACIRDYDREKNHWK